LRDRRWFPEVIMGGAKPARRSKESAEKRSFKIRPELHQRVAVLAGLLDRSMEGTLEWLLDLPGHPELRAAQEAIERAKRKGV
jgi:hypothetical protein